MSVSLTRALCFSLFSLVGVSACQQAPSSDTQPASLEDGNYIAIEHEKYTLPNGLTVILHEDHSDPLVHVDVTYHVGSAREEIGKSGFAHFFEHMMFQGSKHVPDEVHFRVVTEAGGTLNGTTNTDRTNYYQTVPSNQLEKVLWLESDRMGFLLDAVDQVKFENQRDTVKNERAQRVDNQPYGLRFELIGEALYPEGHPYSWSTIGYVEDLDRVDVNDLKAFFSRWYGPNNAVLTIGGDIDLAQTKSWIEHYFGGIPRGPEVAEPEPFTVTLDEDRYVTLEDNVHMPLLQIVYPTVYAHHADEAALDVLADILGGGKTSLFYQNLVKEGLAVQAVVSHPCKELACEFQLLALANPNKVTSLSTLQDIVNKTLVEFESRGVTDEDLARTKSAIESSTIFGLQSVSGKVSALAANQTFYQQPDMIAENIARYNAVTKDDVMRVYNTYIKQNHSVILSVVPAGQSLVAAAPQTFDRPVRTLPDYSQTAPTETFASPPSRIDRSSVPTSGPAPVVQVPDYWTGELENGVTVLGVTSDETPTVTLSISLEGGILLDSLEKAGTASLTAMMMNESTLHYSNEEMANALAMLGSSISISSGGRYTQVSVSSLTKNLKATLALVEEKLFNPAFLESDFLRIRERVLQSLQQQARTPNSLATRARDLVLFGENNRVAYPSEGTLDTVMQITLDDVKSFYAAFYSPAKASVVAVSDLSQMELLNEISFLGKWEGQDYQIGAYKSFPEYDKQNMFFVNSPGAVQAVVYVVDHSLPFDANGEHFKTRLMNFPLGGGFNSRINMNLREEKGLTYGANSAFIGGKTLGWFEAASDINATGVGQGITEIFNEINGYLASGVTEDEIEFMQNAYTLGDALDYETPRSKAQFLRQLLGYNLSSDYRAKQIEIIQGIDKAQIDALAQKHLNPSQMQIIVVGDKTAILPQLMSLDIPIIEFDVELRKQEPLH